MKYLYHSIIIKLLTNKSHNTTNNSYIYIYMTKSQAWHYEGYIVYNLLDIFLPGPIQLRDVLSEADQRPHGAEERLQEDGEGARHCDLSLVLCQSLSDDLQRLPQQGEVSCDLYGLHIGLHLDFSEKRKQERWW